MSADLLRRAADKLRKDVAALPADWRERPWTPVLTDSESLTGVRTCDAPHDGDEDDDDSTALADWACDRCEHFETYSEGLASYVCTMHPAVALPLADAMDAVAKAVQYGGGFAARVGYGELIAVARAVLREDGAE